jgi:predicted unusual protein kinase regulating ubiquinone biosynthesis (AarF/ABC1/UbiB family)
MEWVEAARITDVDFLEENQIDRVHIADRLFRVFLPQWLEAGMFHADPHAGNVLVTSNGTMVLLDFGMSGEISKNDAANFQNLLEAFLLKNYPKMAEVLLELGFLLPETNPRTIEGLLKKTMSFNLADFKKMGLFAAKKEINDLVKALPIQVPTRFIFLGRSFATIEGMLHTICPGKETIELMEPAFLDWINQSPTSKWKIILKWISALPIFRIAHSISDVLHVPQQYVELKETQQQRELYFSRFENLKMQAFLLGLFGLTGVFTGEYLHDAWIWKGSLCLIGIAAIAFFIASMRQRKWLKKLRFQGKYRGS